MQAVNSIKEELANLHQAATVTRPYFTENKEIKKFIDELITNCLNLFAKVETALSIIDAAKQDLQMFDVLEIQDMKHLVESLSLLEKQDTSSENTSPQGRFVATSNILVQLQNAPTKVQALLHSQQYEHVNTILFNLRQLRKSAPLQTICTKAEEEIEALIKKHQTSLIDHFKEMFTSKQFSEVDIVLTLSTKFDQVFSEELSMNFEPLMPKLVAKFQELIDVTGSSQPIPSQSIPTLTDTICQLHSLTLLVSNHKIQALIHDRIESFLSEVSREGIDLYQLGVFLVDTIPDCAEITETHPKFQAIKTKLQNEAFKTAGIDINHALKDLGGEPYNFSEESVELLRKRYEEYKKFEAQFSNKYIQGFGGFAKAEPPEKLIQQMKDLTRRHWSNPLKPEDCVQLLAGIFTVWTVQTSQNMFQSSNNNIDCLIRPNVAQLLALFRLLGLDSYNSGKKVGFSKKSGRAIQVGTGEGKSILLGGLSCFLALVGFDVSCASYSKHLSQRDYDAFKPLFRQFEVIDHVHYSTLAELAESIINREGDIRNLTLSHIFVNFTLPGSAPPTGSAHHSHDHHRRAVLLFDEMDVFFGEDFYGIPYAPVAEFVSNETRSILQHIWKFKDKIKLQDIQKLQAYQDLLQKAQPEAWPLIDNQINLMLLDVHTFADPPYEIVEKDGGHKLIGYKRQDSVDTSVKYRYKTTFAYLYEAQKHPAIENEVQSKLALQIPCGVFAYAAIPQEHFEFTLGVSGTLLSLNDAEIDIIKKEYNILEMTAMPSIYGDRKLQFNKGTDVVVWDDINRYYQEILFDIQAERDKGRAVIVYFETEQKIDDFLSSSYGSRLTRKNERINIVTEKTANIQFYVNRATRAKEVTFFPKSFGRGLDFISRVPAVNEAGGVHVVQTFFSEHPSEEIQIKGRTARQANKGSFKIIIFHQDLAKFNISANELQNKDNNYEVLCKKREVKVSKKVDELQERVTLSMKGGHVLSQELLQKLLAHKISTKAIVENIEQISQNQNRAQGPVHVLFCLDESGSMENEWKSVTSATGGFLEVLTESDHSEYIFSVIQFSHKERVVLERKSLTQTIQAVNNLEFKGGGTYFKPALTRALAILNNKRHAHAGSDAVVIFMTDGECSDEYEAVKAAQRLYNNTPGELLFFGVAFRENVSTLQTMVGVFPTGKFLRAEDVHALGLQFKRIAREVTAQYAKS